MRVLKDRAPEGGGQAALVDADSEAKAIAEVNFVSNEAAWWMCAVLALNLHALTAWRTLGQDRPGSAGSKPGASS